MERSWRRDEVKIGFEICVMLVIRPSFVDAEEAKGRCRKVDNQRCAYGRL
jgi:hypothetical protein